MLTNYSIGTRVTLAFLVLVVGILVLGGFSIYGLSQINGRLEDVGKNWLPSVKASASMSAMVGNVRRASGQMLLARNSDETKAVEELSVRYHEGLDELFKVYEPLISSPEEGELYKTFRAKWENYSKIEKTALDTASSGNKDKAIDIYLTDSRPVYLDAVASLEKIVKLNEDGAKDAVQSGEATNQTARTMVISVIILVAVLAIAMGVFMVRSISHPIRQLSGVMGDLANAKWDTPVPYQSQADEIGLMSRSVSVFAKNGREAESMRQAQDREQAAKQKRAELMERYINEFEGTIGNLTRGLAAAAVEMQSSAQTMLAIAERTSGQASVVAASANEASTNVQTVAAASEELSASIVEISKQMSMASSVAGHAVKQAESTDAQMRALSEAAEKISTVVLMINEIASQTNLLALNATIEAARAGEAGKGFAVVASEVKNLANETEKATEDISKQVGNMQQISIKSVDAIKEISSTISQINGISVAVSSAVEEQGAATQEISRNVQEAAQGTGDVTENISTVTQAADETRLTSSQVLSAAEELARMAEQLSGEVSRFLGQVRSA